MKLRWVEKNSPAELLLENQLENRPLAYHLAELRRRVLYVLFSLGISFFFCFTFGADQLMQLVTSPVNQLGISLIYIGLGEALTAQLKVCLLSALILVLPVVLWQGWLFLKPALYPQEKQQFFKVALIICFLFILGVLFGYLVVFVMAVTFFVYVGQGFATPMLSINDYLSFLLGFVLPFGLAFELPVICYLLGKAGLVTSASLIEARRYIILGIFIVAGVLTPPDVLSQIMMAVPLLVLYEAGILVLKYTEKAAASR